MANNDVSVEDDELFTWLVALANSDSEGSVEVSLSRAKAVYKRIAERESQAELRGQMNGVNKELDRLDGVLDILDLHEDDLQKLKTWVRNARWAVIAPVGENTSAAAPTSDDTATDGGES